MKSFSQDLGKPNEVHVNYVFYANKLLRSIYYFEKLNIFFVKK